MTLESVCEVAWRQMFPNTGDESSITREEVIESGKIFYARTLWILSKTEKIQEGYFNVPSNLLTEVKLDVKDGEVDLVGLNIMRSLPTWLQNIGGLTCDCPYIVSDVNLTQLLCDDDSQEGIKTAVVVGNKIKFPQGTHASPISIIYANDGTMIDEKEVDVDESVAATVREQLINLYLRRTEEDATNNSNSSK